VRHSVNGRADQIGTRTPALERSRQPRRSRRRHARIAYVSDNPNAHRRDDRVGRTAVGLAATASAAGSECWKSSAPAARWASTRVAAPPAERQPVALASGRGSGRQQADRRLSQPRPAGLPGSCQRADDKRRRVSAGCDEQVCRFVRVETCIGAHADMCLGRAWGPRMPRGAGMRWRVMWCSRGCGCRRGLRATARVRLRSAITGS
jgi:hypothetical protein